MLRNEKKIHRALRPRVEHDPESGARAVIIMNRVNVDVCLSCETRESDDR